MENHRLVEATLKGLIGGGIAVTFTLLFHSFILPTESIRWSLIAVTIGSFFSGFFAEYTDKITCEGDKDNRKNQYAAIGTVFFVLGVTNVMDNKIASGLYVAGGLLMGLAAYRESEKALTEVI